MNNKKDIRYFLANLIIILLWASAFAGIRVGLEDFSPGQLVFLRLLFASLGLFLFVQIRRIKFPEWKDLPIIFLSGLLGFVFYHAGVSYGETSVSAGEASLLVSTTPIFTAILASGFFSERMGLLGWIGSIVGFIGVAIISIGTDGNFTFNIGALFILLASLSESVFFVFQIPLIKKYGVVAFTTYAIWAATLFSLVFLPGTFSAAANANIHSILSIMYLGFFPTIIPYLALAYVTSRFGASEATSSLYLTPTLAFVIAWIWLGEVPAWLTIIGGTITLLGVFLSSLSFPASSKGPQTD
ncbi:DMT family transporter [Pseudalkalibacillus caeni]|uniref:DMT family transporter n=1 Tax=Exobacillus caeni TaxID=2574798 RepID=A0A5R9EX74_9BACL|nr:DMT family transporter [Pseudalkalibacillus caeni]TLS35461.1 DMT family transporter [Pseudalkalibacillus caeni]